MAGIRKKHSKETKLKVVLAVLAGDRPVAQIAQEYGVHPAQSGRRRL
jgi:transposase-like protein